VGDARGGGVMTGAAGVRKGKAPAVTAGAGPFHLLPQWQPAGLTTGRSEIDAGLHHQGEGDGESSSFCPVWWVRLNHLPLEFRASPRSS
jgi:hypothetical protein